MSRARVLLLFVALVVQPYLVYTFSLQRSTLSRLISPTNKIFSSYTAASLYKAQTTTCLVNSYEDRRQHYYNNKKDAKSLIAVHAGSNPSKSIETSELNTTEDNAVEDDKTFWRLVILGITIVWATNFPIIKVSTYI